MSEKVKVDIPDDRAIERRELFKQVAVMTYLMDRICVAVMNLDDSQYIKLCTDSEIMQQAKLYTNAILQAADEMEGEQCK